MAASCFVHRNCGVTTRHIRKKSDSAPQGFGRHLRREPMRRRALITAIGGCARVRGIVMQISGELDRTVFHRAADRHGSAIAKCGTSSAKPYASACGTPHSELFGHNKKARFSLTPPYPRRVDLNNRPHVAETVVLKITRFLRMLRRGDAHGATARRMTA